MQISFYLDDTLYWKIIDLFEKSTTIKSGRNVSDKWRYISEWFMFLNSSKFDHSFDLWNDGDFYNTPNKNTLRIEEFNYPHCEKFDF